MTVLLPAVPTIGETVTILNVSPTVNMNVITIDGNGNLVMGQAAPGFVGQGNVVNLIFLGARGWRYQS